MSKPNLSLPSTGFGLKVIVVGAAVIVGYKMFVSDEQKIKFRSWLS